MTVPGVSQLADIRSGVWTCWVWALARAWEHFASREVLRELQFVLAVLLCNATAPPA